MEQQMILQIEINHPHHHTHVVVERVADLLVHPVVQVVAPVHLATSSC